MRYNYVIESDKEGLMKDKNEQREEEVLNFLIICNDVDRGFWDLPQNDRKTEDYVRLLTIARLLGCKWVATRLSLEAVQDEKVHEIISRLHAVLKNYEIIIDWMDHFVDNIPIPEYKKAVYELWEEEKEKIRLGGKIFDN